MLPVAETSKYWGPTIHASTSHVYPPRLHVAETFHVCAYQRDETHPTKNNMLPVADSFPHPLSTMTTHIALEHVTLHVCTQTTTTWLPVLDGRVLNEIHIILPTPQVITHTFAQFITFHMLQFPDRTPRPLRCFTRHNETMCVIPSTSDTWYDGIPTTQTLVHT